jgi:hypothetical protein
MGGVHNHPLDCQNSAVSFRATFTASWHHCSKSQESVAKKIVMAAKALRSSNEAAHSQQPKRLTCQPEPAYSPPAPPLLETRGTQK